MRRLQETVCCGETTAEILLRVRGAENKRKGKNPYDEAAREEKVVVLRLKQSDLRFKREFIQQNHEIRQVYKRGSMFPCLSSETAV